jgi:hypothetical protein
MGYYIVKVNFESGEVNRKGDPVVNRSEFLVPGESILEVETKVAEYLSDSVSSYESVQITKSKIEAVL